MLNLEHKLMRETSSRANSEKLGEIERLKSYLLQIKDENE